MKRTLPALASALILTACTGMTSPERAATPADEFEALAAQADAEIRRAAEKGALWLHTEGFLNQAREAHAAGETQKAVSLARKALAQALLARKQAADNANVKADFTFRQ